MLQDIFPILKKLTASQNLSTEEARKLFNVIGDEDAEGDYHTAAYTGVMSKGPTVDELLGFCLDRADRIGTVDVGIPADQITDISGGGGDTIKTMNVSTAASFVIAASGLYVAKQAAGAFTGTTGSTDIAAAMGVDVPFDQCDVKNISAALQKNHIFIYNYACLAPERFKNYLAWRKKIVESKQAFHIPQHIVSFAYSPILLGSRVYGLAQEKNLMLLAQVLQKLGVKQGIVLSGLDGLDEASNIGQTKLVEFRGSKITEYEVAPNDFGVKKAAIKDIAAQGKEENILDFVRVLFGKENGPKTDLVAINAGTCLYIAGRADSLKTGTQLALSLIRDGKAGSQLEKTVAYFGNTAQLENLKSKAGIH